MAQTFKLEKPFLPPGKEPGEEVTEFQIKRDPEAGDFWEMDLGKPKTGDLLRVFGKMTGQLDTTLKKMSLVDMMKAVEIVTSFMPQSQET